MKYNALTLIYHMHRHRHRQEKPIFPLSGPGLAQPDRLPACLPGCAMPTQRLRYENGNENGNLVVSEQRSNGKTPS